jgi:hypothetical protein
MLSRNVGYAPLSDIGSNAEAAEAQRTRRDYIVGALKLGGDRVNRSKNMATGLSNRDNLELRVRIYRMAERQLTKNKNVLCVLCASAAFAFNEIV